MGWRRVMPVLAISTLVLAVPATSGRDSRSAPPGGLVRTTLSTEVGVVLDEIPASMRDRVAAAMLAEPRSFWLARARDQLRLTTYRLVFREAFYDAKEKKSALPLPPEAKWQIDLAGRPRRHTVDGHDLVGVHYSFASVLLSNASSPGKAELRLAKVGGVWREPFVLPIDPELLFQRTGFACMDESQYPFGSVDSEEPQFFYDQLPCRRRRSRRSGTTSRRCRSSPASPPCTTTSAP